VPFTPLAALIGLLALLRVHPKETAEERLNAIPISLLSPEEMEALGASPSEPPPAKAEEAPPPEPAEPTEPAPPPKPKPKPKPKPLETPDGGAVVPADAAPPPKKIARGEPARGPDGGGAAPSSPGTPDPLGLAGKAASVADPNANVKLLLINERLRGLAIAPRLGRLVARLPQWASFFGPTGLDPVRDIRRLYVAGPQFRSSSEVVALIEYEVPRPSMQKAIDSIVKREPKGEWLDAPIPAARARADRADRVFVLPKSRVLLMVPPRLKDDAIAKAPGLSLPSIPGSAVVVAFVANPWRALSGHSTPVEIPKTISSVSITATPSEDGGAVLHVEARDATAATAAENAVVLTRAINLLTQRNVGAIGAILFGGQKLSLIEPIDLRSEGTTIRGDAIVTPRQLERLIGFAEGWVDAVMGVPLSSATPPGAPRPGAPGFRPVSPSLSPTPTSSPATPRAPTPPSTPTPATPRIPTAAPAPAPALPP